MLSATDMHARRMPLKTITYKTKGIVVYTSEKQSSRGSHEEAWSFPGPRLLRVFLLPWLGFLLKMKKIKIKMKKIKILRQNNSRYNMKITFKQSTHHMFYR